MKTKTFKIAVIGYKTPAGKPTCSLGAGGRCQFYATTKMGFVDICTYVADDDNILLRKTETDYLIPHGQCPLWGNK